MTTKRKSKKNKKKQTGGNLIASGGFGCIFSPALKCHNQDSNHIYTNKITKLMISKDAQDEYNQIQEFKNILQSIPNYDKYFLLNDITLCKPNILTNTDLNNYKKCKPLNKKNITSKNINKKLDQILAINMPNAGLEITNFINKYFNSHNIILLNNSLINLLVNGIAPMNQLNVYHCDIKDGNILAQFTNNKQNIETKLIDWGISIIYTNNSQIPYKLYKRPFQYNTPFSTILFNDIFIKNYQQFLSINNYPTYYQIREFVINYIFIWNDIRGDGHLSAINDIVQKLTINDLEPINNNTIKLKFIEHNITYHYIIQYLANILQKYTIKGKLDIISYFTNVFLKNIDIWGFVMSYIVIYEYLYEYFNKLNYYHILFINKIKYIIIHFLYETSTEPIDIKT
jgi:hypothetical protein